MYKFLRRNGFILPSVSTLKLMLTSYKTKPGFNKKLFQRLQQKARTMEEKEEMYTSIRRNGYKTGSTIFKNIWRSTRF